MVSKPHGGSFDEPPQQPAQDLPPSSADELVAFAQEYFSSDFPNAQRLGCSIKGTLAGLVRAGNAPDDRLRSHLFGCSECFREYQSALAAYRAEINEGAAARVDPWWKRSLPPVLMKPIPVFAGALALIALALAGIFVSREYRTAPQQIVARRDSELVATPSVSPARNLPSPTLEESPSVLAAVPTTRGPSANRSQQKAAVQPVPERPSSEGELIAMSIDLEAHAVTRGGAVNGGEISFPSARTRLSLTLPSGSAKGVYTVSVVGASGIALETSSVRSTDGKFLKATLNMQKLTPQKYSLRISREGEPPIDVPIVVTAEKTVSPVKKP